MGLPPVVNFAEAERLLRLMKLRTVKRDIPGAWFTRSELASMSQRTNDLRTALILMNQTEANASSLFTADALQAPLTDLQDRFTNLHRGLKKLSRSYRADKNAISAVLLDAANVKVGIRSLSDAISWAQATRSFQQFADTNQAAYGKLWTGRSTDLDAVDEALVFVGQVLETVDGPISPPLVAYLIGADSNETFRTIAEAIETDLSEWKGRLRKGTALTAPPEILLSPIEDAVTWLTRSAEHLRCSARRIRPVSDLIGNDCTFSQADEIIGLLEHTTALESQFTLSEQLYRNAFGQRFLFEHTDLVGLDGLIDWAAKIRAFAGGQLSETQVAALDTVKPLESISSSYQKWLDAQERVITAFKPTRHRELRSELNDFDDAKSLLGELRQDSTGQHEWHEYQRINVELAPWGLDSVLDFCAKQRVSSSDVSGIVRRALLQAWIDYVVQTDERLKPFQALERERIVEEFQTLDRELLSAATSEIILSANTRRPVNTSIGESGVIRREGSKQKRHRPVREVMSMARSVIQGIKPVFMMSPLAVSQYLPSDMKFDVVIFDEASQVTPGDAVNCIYRGSSLILAGDDKQLPPTSFFSRSVDDEEDDSDIKDFQSVLELAKASGAFNNLGLKWHYRSRHEALIAFSNYKFYEGGLITFPSALQDGADIGVELIRVNGTYRRGGGAYNPVEAAKVAERVIEHFSTRPDLSLGVVTFSVAQADAVQNAIDQALEVRRDLDRFFDTEDRLDGFFVRALEQVQGDERDVMIFSIGYGPDEAGKISTNFGALNKDKGWRRLNVAITRARQRVEVISSMKAGQIPPSTNENVEYFRSYLDYAERGTETLAVPYSSTGLDPESPFEEAVIKAIQRWGYIVEPQVGAAGYRLDIGVRHTEYPGMFALGVECDGYQYHSAPSARDRDRLRDQVLTNLGWRLHRIWGTAWYRDQATEEARLKAAIEDAMTAPLNNRTKQVPLVERPMIQAEQVDLEVNARWIAEYTFSPNYAPPGWLEAGDWDAYQYIVEMVETLVQHESPIHLDFVFGRICNWWHVGRMGSRIRDNIHRAIEIAEVVQDGDFLLAPDGEVHLVRGAHEAIARKVQHVHLDELSLAATLLVRDAAAAPRSEVAQGVSRIFGWARTGKNVLERIEEAIDQSIQAGQINEDEGQLRIAPDSTIGLSPAPPSGSSF